MEGNVEPEIRTSCPRQLADPGKVRRETNWHGGGSLQVVIP
jgi:hypothetical protein